MKKRLLVVEDDVRLLQAIAVCLRKEGFEVMTARGGAAALLQIAETIPDLIVSDVMMPGADGYELLNQIRANPRTDLIPVVFLTAKDLRRDRVEGFRAGVDAYLTKPFEPDELVAVIKNILHRVARTHTRVARVQPATAAKPPAAASSSSANDRQQSLSPPSAEPSAGGGMTEAETRVAQLIAESLSNKEIAARLGISVRTVEMYVSHILAKNNWSNRVEIARHVIRRDSSSG